jgi:hypothetical protein
MNKLQMLVGQATQLQRLVAGTEVAIAGELVLKIVQ